MRSNDTTMPPARGTAAPDRPVPLPRAVTGMLCSFATRSRSDDLGRAAGADDERRRLGRRGEGLVVAVVVADLVAGQDVLGRHRLAEERGDVGHVRAAGP